MYQYCARTYISICIICVCVIFMLLYYTREHYQDLVIPGVYNRKYSIPSATENKLADEAAFMKRYKYL